MPPVRSQKAKQGSGGYGCRGEQLKGVRRAHMELHKPMKLTIPMIPPSVNHYVKHTRSGRHYVTKEAIAFKDAIAIISRGERVEGQRFQVNVKLYLGKGQRLDCDNCGKVILDGLAKAGVISSDARVTALQVEKFRDPQRPRTEIEIVGL